MQKVLYPILSIGLIGMALFASCSLEPGTAPNDSGSVLKLSEGWERYAGVREEAELGAPSGPAHSTFDYHPRSSLFDFEPPPAGPLTYHKSLRLAKGEEHCALVLPGAAGFAAVKINGETIYQRGVDPDPGSLLHFTAPSGEVSIIIQSDSDGPRLEDPGLVPRPLLIGGDHEVSHFMQVYSSIAAVETGFFIICGIFVLILFLFWQKNRDFLSLAFFMEGAGLFTIGRTAAIFGYLSAPRPWLSCLSLATGMVLVIPLAFLFGAAFRGRAGKTVKAASIAISAALAAASALVLFRPALERVLQIASLSWYAAFFLVSLAFLAAGARKKERKTYWLLPTGSLCFLALLGQELLRDSLAASLFIESASLVVFSFVAMLMLLKRIGDSFEATETLTDYVSNVTSTLGRFIPREFLDCLNKSDVTDLRLGDHVKKEMTIFFSDIRSFTELSERLTVEENFAFINSYLSRMVPILTENGGFVDKYIGDGIMALFAGREGPDQAIRAAIAMQNKMVEYNGHRANSGYRPISMGVGVHTGDLMLGVIGVDDRMENTVISDAVNLASRLQSVTKAFNISLAISEQAFKELEDPGIYKYRFIGKVKVKGKSAPVSVFEIFDGIAPELFEKKMKANTYFEQGMLAYYQKDFNGAMYYFKRVLEIMPEDGAAAFYLETCINKVEL